jgi:hypothetical protein
MNHSDFVAALHVLRRAAETDNPALMGLVLEAEALLDGRPTISPRDEVVAAVRRLIKIED